jgi:hypothetical protein
MPRLQQRHTRTASPPTPVGNTWLKNIPTKTIFSKAAAPGEGASADRMRCQRNATTVLVAKSTTNVAANSGGAACPIICAARLKSIRSARTHNNPAVAKSRTLVISNLRM